MSTLSSFLVVLILFFFCDKCVSQVAYSECLVGRLTRGGTNSNTCGLDVASEQGAYPSWVANLLIGADDETYNGFPFIEDAIYMNQGGTGDFCGACIEIVSSSGQQVTVMVSDICDNGCPGCQFCNGSQGNDIAQLGFKEYNDDVYETLTLGSGAGSNVISYRWVRCDFDDYNMGLYFPTDGNIDQNYLAIVVYLHSVPLSMVEVRSDGGSFVEMVRVWTNKWEYITPTNPSLVFPIQFRLTSVFGDVVTSPRTFSLDDINPRERLHSLEVQFTEEHASLEVEDCCEYPGPARYIYTEGELQGELQLRFQIIESTNPLNPPDFDYTDPPCDGGSSFTCIRFPNQNPFFPLLVQYRTWFNASNFYTGISFECAVLGVSSAHGMSVTYDDGNPSVDFDCSANSFSSHSFTFSEMGVANMLVREFKIGSGVTGPTSYLIRSLQFTGPVPPGRDVQTPYNYPLVPGPPNPDACAPNYGTYETDDDDSDSVSASHELNGVCFI